MAKEKVIDENKKIAGERFSLLLKLLGTSPVELRDRLGLETPTKFYNLQKGLFYPSFENMKELKKLFPEINLNWWVTGEGEPLKNAPENAPENATKREENSEINTILTPSTGEGMTNFLINQVDHLNKTVEYLREENSDLKSENKRLRDTTNANTFQANDYQSEQSKSQSPDNMRKTAEG